MRIIVKQGAVFFFRFNVLLLEHRIFDGDTDAVADQFQNVFLFMIEIHRISAADAYDTKGFLFLGADGNIGNRCDLFAFQREDFIRTIFR